MARLPILFQYKTKRVKELIPQANLILGVDSSIIEDVMMHQFKFLREFFEKPEYAGIYLKYLGTWYTNPYSLLNQIRRLIKAYRKKVLPSTLKLITHLFKLRHNVYEYRERSKQPNQARNKGIKIINLGEFKSSNSHLHKTPWHANKF